MDKRIIQICAAILIVLTLASCGSTCNLIPQASSTIKYASFEELNLTSKDYEVLDRIEVSARIEATFTNTFCTITDPDGTFELHFKKDKNGQWIIDRYSGVVRAGYLSQDIDFSAPRTPDEFAHRMAIYRLINLVKEQGGDGIIEPVISTSVEENKSGWGSVKYTLLTTVSGKAIRLKTSNK